MKRTRLFRLTAIGLATLAFLPDAVSAADRDAMPDPPVVSRGSLTLGQALLIAASDNVTLKQSQADADAASAAARAARAQSQPSLSTTTYGAVGDSSNVLTSTLGVSPQNIFVVPPRGFADQNVTLMAPLFTGGKLQNSEAAARLQGIAAQQAVEATRVGVVQAVTTDYIDAVLQQALVAAAQAHLTSENEQVRVTQEEVSTGRSAPVNLLREQAEQADAQQAVFAAQNEAALALVRLKSALGISQASEIVLSDTLDALSAAPALPGTMQAAVRQAELRRPEMARARMGIEAAKAGVAAAHATYSPQVYGVAMADAMTGLGKGRAGYTLGLAASLPLWDGGQRKANNDEAAARLARATADAQQAQQQVDEEVATAWLTTQTAQSEVAAAAAGLAAANQGFILADLRYNAGKSVAAERLDALSALKRAEATSLQSQAGLAAARTQLKAAVGLL